MSFISESTIQAVNDQLDAVAIIGDYIKLEKRGGRYWGLCPFHTERTASFTVDAERRFFYCFGCGKGGGVINFIMEMEKISFPEVIEQLAKKYGIPIIREGTSLNSKAFNRNNNLSNSLVELYDRVGGSFHYILLHSDSAEQYRRYLKTRVISDEMIQKFKLGFSPADRNWLYGFLSKKGYSESLLNESGLFSRKYKKTSFFNDRLIFPIVNRNNQTIAFGGRTLRDSSPKYLNSPETLIFKKAENLFAINQALLAIRQTKIVYICEGYMDAISMHQAGIKNTVAPLGTTFTEGHIRMLKRWVEKVVFIFDSDNAGINATIKAILLCRKFSLPCYIAAIEKGKDPADILKDYGVEALQKITESYITDFEFLTNLAKVRYDFNQTEGLNQATSFFFQFLEPLESEIEKAAFVDKIADVLNVDKTAVYHDYLNYLGKKTARPRSFEPTESDISVNDELILMMAVAFNRELFQKLRNSITVNEIDNKYAKELFISLEECYRAEFYSIDFLLSKIQNPKLQKTLLNRVTSGMPIQNLDLVVNDGIKRIKIRTCEKRRVELLRKIRQIQNGSTDMLDGLLGEISYLDMEIARLKDANE